MTDCSTKEFTITLPQDTADLFERFCDAQPLSPQSNIASRLIRNGIEAVLLLHPHFQEAVKHTPHPNSEAADALTAAQARIAELEAALTSMVYRHELYCGGPDLPFAGHTDKKLMRFAKKALKTKGQEQ